MKKCEQNTIIFKQYVLIMQTSVYDFSCKITRISFFLNSCICARQIFPVHCQGKCRKLSRKYSKQRVQQCRLFLFVSTFVYNKLKLSFELNYRPKLHSLCQIPSVDWWTRLSQFAQPLQQVNKDDIALPNSRIFTTTKKGRKL